MRKIVTLILICFTSHLIAQTDFQNNLSESAMELTKDKVFYDPSYFSIAYPNGDVPKDRGVCTDVVIRAYRKLGIDLQKEVHEDMKLNFSIYPQRWGLKTTDKNIDHRRVPNLMQFFSRKGVVKPKSIKEQDYKPGDIVCWDLGGGILHIGLLVNKKSEDGLRYLVVHNVGGGQVAEDVLFDWKIIGHYSYRKLLCNHLVRLKKEEKHSCKMLVVRCLYL